MGSPEGRPTVKKRRGKTVNTQGLKTNRIVTKVIIATTHLHREIQMLKLFTKRERVSGTVSI